MTPHIIILNPSIFIDIEGAYIPYSQQSEEHPGQEQIKRSKTPFSEIKTGKFRKLFNRHSIYR